MLRTRLADAPCSTRGGAPRSRPGLPPAPAAVSRPGGRVGAVPAETASDSRPSPPRPSDRSAGAPFGAAASWPRAGLPERCERPSGRGGDGRRSLERRPAAGPCGPSAVRRRADGWLRPPSSVVAPPRRSHRAAREGRGASKGRPGGLARPLRRVAPGRLFARLATNRSREFRSAAAARGRPLPFARRLDPPRSSRPGVGDSSRNPRPSGWTRPAAPTFGVRTAGGRSTCCRI